VSQVVQTEIFSRASRQASIEKGTMLDDDKGVSENSDWRLDDLTEWTERTLPELVRLAEDHSAYRRFIRGVNDVSDAVVTCEMKLFW